MPHSRGLRQLRRVPQPWSAPSAGRTSRRENRSPAAPAAFRCNRGVEVAATPADPASAPALATAATGTIVARPSPATRKPTSAHHTAGAGAPSSIPVAAVAPLRTRVRVCPSRSGRRVPDSLPAVMVRANREYPSAATPGSASSYRSRWSATQSAIAPSPQAVQSVMNVGKPLAEGLYEVSLRSSRSTHEATNRS